MSDIDQRDDHTGAPPLPWSSVELIVDPQRSLDTEATVREWAQANAGWVVSAVSREEIIRRGLDSLPSSALRSKLAVWPDFAVDFGRFITLAAGSRTVSVGPDVPSSDLTPNLKGSHGCILFDERGITPLVIAMMADSVFCASTIRVAMRVIEDGQDTAFAAVIEAAASAARLLDVDVPRLVREMNLEWPRARSKVQSRKKEDWTRFLRHPRANGHLGRHGTDGRHLTRLALAETAAVIVGGAYL
jgi:hypothetical protein